MRTGKRSLECVGRTLHQPTVTTNLRQFEL